MSNMKNGQQLGRNQGKGADASDPLGLFLKVFGGEVLVAFKRHSVTTNNHLKRTIPSGKSAKFPVIGRTAARYLKQGQSLDDGRVEIPHSERTVDIDGLLTSDVFIYDIEDAMNEFDVRAEYSNQLGESLAMAADGSNLAEIAKLVALDPTMDENIIGLGKPIKIIVPIQEVETAEQMKTLGLELITALVKARAGFTKNYVPKLDRVAYATPDAYSAILTALMPNAANYHTIIDPETGDIKNVMGFRVIETVDLTRGGVDDTNSYNGSGHAFPTAGFVTKDNVQVLLGHRSTIGQVVLKDVALERARRPEYQADQIIAKHAMGHGGLRPEAAGAIVMGVKVPPVDPEGRRRRTAAK